MPLSRRFCRSVSVLSFAADHPDIPGLGPHGLFENNPIVLMSPGDNHDIGMAVKPYPVKRAREILHDDLIGIGKSLAIGIFGPVITNHHAQSAPTGRSARCGRTHARPRR